MDLHSLSRRVSSQLPPGSASVHLISSQCTYYHYLCDGTDDRGWGCGYRSLQSLCSWVVTQRVRRRQEGEGGGRGEGGGEGEEEGGGGGEGGGGRVWGDAVAGAGCDVPSVKAIQEALVELGDKPTKFAGSKEWVGCFEACLVLDHLFGVACKIVHVTSGGEVVDHVKMIAEHFDSTGSPIMIGGDVDGASKTLIGLQLDESKPSNTRFLVADPHYCSEVSEDRVLLSDGGVQWHSLGLFQSASFYNFCLPQTP